jgi:hypothetical protein
MCNLRECFRLKNLSFLLNILFAILGVIIIALDITIFSQTLSRASIAVYQFGDGVLIHGLVAAVIVIEILLLLLHLIFIIIPINKRILLTLFYPAISGLIIIKEAVLYKFINCFNYFNRDIIYARSILLILLIIYFVGVGFLHVFDRSNRYSIIETTKPTVLTFILMILFVILSLAVVVLNIVLLTQLGDQLKYDIRPSNIKMGYFNQSEIDTITNGSYKKDAYYSNRIIGNLAQVINSDDKILYRRTCTYSRNGRSCTYVKLTHYKLKNID